MASVSAVGTGRGTLTVVVERDGCGSQEIFLQHGLTIGRNASNAICGGETVATGPH